MSNKLDKILAEISAGELIDKITILEIKKIKISDVNKLKDIEKELLSLNETFKKFIPNSSTIHSLMSNLKSVNLQSDDYLFHAGTSRKDEEVYATGGRVLNFVSLSDDFNDAKMSIQRNLDSLNWSGGFYRKDIGYKVID